MFDSVLNVLSNADLISPTIALFKNARNGPSVRFSVPFALGWSAVQIQEMLKSKGVIVWGLAVEGEDIRFTVRRTQGRYTAYWLDRYRLPYESSMAETGNSSSMSATAKDSDAKGGRQRSGMLDDVLDRIDGLVDNL